MNHSRFTIDGSDALEARLRAISMRASEGVRQIIPQRRLTSLLLGGGYGRGEGGVLRDDDGDRPYNDLEFYVILSGTTPSIYFYNRPIHHLAEELTRAAGIEVEFKLLPLKKLAGSSVTMFYYDLVSGHRLLSGTDEWLTRCEHHRAAHRIPLYEATRLLMNRCSGLLFAQDRLTDEHFTEDHADFIGRNLAKAKLAFGDVVLTMRGQYHWSCRERQKRLKKLVAEKSSGNLTSLLLLHEQGVHFKLHPVRTKRPQADLAAELAFLKEIARELWLQLERRRLGRQFASIPGYALDPSSRCPEKKPLKNRLVNVRTFGLPGIFDWRYPRERLLRSLPLLLWESDLPQFVPFIQRQLKTSNTDPHHLVRAYERLWRNYN